MIKTETLSDLASRRGRLDGLIDLYRVRHEAERGDTESYRQVMAALRMQRAAVDAEIERVKARVA